MLPFKLQHLRADGKRRFHFRFRLPVKGFVRQRLPRLQHGRQRFFDRRHAGKDSRSVLHLLQTCFGLVHFGGVIAGGKGRRHVGLGELHGALALQIIEDFIPAGERRDQFYGHDLDFCQRKIPLRL